MKDNIEMKDDLVRETLLPKRRLIKVRNLAVAQTRLRNWLASCPGRKMRQVAFDSNHLELSDYRGEIVESAIVQLKQCGQYIKQVPWKLHPALRSSSEQ